MNSVIAFWEWFKENKDKYESMSKLEQQKLMNEFLSKLHDFHPQLYFQIGMHKKEPFELVITAEGRIENFEKVEDLVRNAPIIENWKITAFKQPKGYKFSTRYKGIDLNPEKLWFMPLNHPDYPNDLGVRIGIPDFDESKEEDYYFGVSILLETCMGEKAAAFDIDYYDICELTENPTSTGWIAFIDLLDYIKWRKNARST